VYASTLGLVALLFLPGESPEEMRDLTAARWGHRLAVEAEKTGAQPGRSCLTGTGERKIEAQAHPEVRCTKGAAAAVTQQEPRIRFFERRPAP